MKVRMLVHMSGTRNGQPWPSKGEPVDLPAAEAAHLVSAGIAEEVGDEAADVEAATAPPAETSRPPAAKTATPRGKSRTARGDTAKE